MDQKLIDKIEKRKIEETLRSLSCFSDKIDFYSNDYLSASKIPTDNISNIFGSTGSRLISGNSIEAENCETFLADFFNAASALVFNSGYDANVGFFSAIPQRGDTVIYDEHIHASVRDGISLSKADSFSFSHNSVDDLKKKILKSKGTVYVAIEGLYSMDGDIAPLKEIVSVSKEFGAYLIIDEAHSAGVFGESGKGLLNELDLEIDIFARLITFGKAFGAHGGCILGSKILKEYLLNFARSFIFTTALPPKEYFRIENIVGSKSLNEERKLLVQNVKLFRETCQGINLISDERSPIQMLRIGSIEETKRIAEIVLKKGFDVKAIFSPTVKKGSESIRICIHSHNTEKEIRELVVVISDSLL